MLDAMIKALLWRMNSEHQIQFKMLIIISRRQNNAQELIALIIEDSNTKLPVATYAKIGILKLLIHIHILPIIQVVIWQAIIVEILMELHQYGV